MIIHIDNKDELNKYFESVSGKTVALTSGYFDPLHPGHVSSFTDSYNKADFDVYTVVLNGDAMTAIKKGKAFTPAEDRAYIIHEFECVDHVVIFDNKHNTDSNEALDILKPKYFMKGGDRIDIENIPEWDTCIKNGTEVISGVGEDKMWSSSDYLAEWVEFANSQKDSK
jgi:cytidyltransferase-like protein